VGGLVGSLLGGLFLVLAVGALLRWRAGMGAREADTLNRLIMDVTMPALLVDVLATRDLELKGTALASSTIALFVSGALGLVVAKLSRANRATQGAALLTGAFCNTGFLGFPLIVAAFKNDATASSTAIVVDTFNTTLLLWTIGIALAQNFGEASNERGLRAHATTTFRAFARPMTAALLTGIGLRAFHVELPPFLASSLSSLGNCTTPLVFLALGMQLDLKAVAANVVVVVAVALVKLVASPLVALGVARGLHVDEPAASAAVLQSAMPSAMASVIVAARTGCDRSVAAGVATLTTLLCIASLPGVAWLLDVTR
jgi:predicted permease